MIKKIVIGLLFFISGGAFIILKWADYLYPLFLFLLVLALLISRRRITFSIRSGFAQISLLLIFLLLILFRGEDLIFADNIEILVKFVLIVVLGLYCTTYYNSSLEFYTDLVGVFEKILYLSLITFVISNLIPPLMVDIGGKDELGNQFQTVFGLGYGRTLDYQKYNFFRNQGIFWEPGVMGLFVTIVYMLKRFFLKDKSKSWLYYVVILTTVSMGSIIVFFILEVFRHILKGTRAQIIRKMFIFVPLIFLPFLLVVLLAIYFPKEGIAIISFIFQRDVNDDSSILTRYYDLYYGFKAATSEFLIGHGRDYREYYALTTSAVNKSKEDYNGGITNSIINTFYCYGAPFLCYYLWLLYKKCSTFAYNITHPMLIFLVIVGCLMIEPMQFSLFMILLVTYTDKGKKIYIS